MCACVRHACLCAPCVAWPLLLPMFALLLFLFWPRRLLTHFGESPVCENLFPPIFWHNQKLYAIFFLKLGNFNFFTKKQIFQRFFNFLRPAFGHGRQSATSSQAQSARSSQAQSKVIFRPFFCFLRPAFGHGRLGHPQSLEY